MNTTVEKLPDCKASIRVEVPAADVNAQRSQIVKAYTKQARIPGYRPGKTPAAVVEKKFRKEIEDELQDRLIRTACQEAAEKESLDLMGVSKVDETLFQPDGAFTFTAEVVLNPEFELPEYKGIPVEVPRIEVTDTNIDHVLEHMRERFSDFDDITDRPAEMGDFAIINYSGTLDGKPLAEANEQAAGALAGNEDYWVKVDEESFLPGFCPQLEGMSVGEKREIKVTLGDDFPIEDLRGKELIYDVELRGIKAQKLPELNDELAGKIAPGKTLEELREDIRQGLTGEQENRRRELISNQVLRFLGEKLDFELPRHVVFSETQRQVNDIVYENQNRGVAEEELIEHQEEIMQSAEVRAKINVKTSFILDKIAEKEGIQATQQEILQRVAQMAAQQGQKMDKLMKRIQKESGFGAIANQIRVGKTLEFLKSNASVSEVDPPAGEDAHDHDHEHEHA